MSEQDKERLARIRDSKRDAKSTPKRMSPDQLRIGCDYAEDYRQEIPGLCYWRWVPNWWTTILRDRFPWNFMRVRQGKDKWRIALVFSLADMLPIMHFLRLHKRYLCGWCYERPKEEFMAFSRAMNRLERLSKEIEREGR